jgi:Cu(I)/Ag(I) efflux system membrane protein CusA/SilA
MAGLMPILWAHGTVSEVMSRIAVPMIGGMVSSTILTLVVIPAVYALINGRRLEKAGSEETERVLTLSGSISASLRN